MLTNFETILYCKNCYVSSPSYTAEIPTHKFVLRRSKLDPDEVELECFLGAKKKYYVSLRSTFKTVELNFGAEGGLFPQANLHPHDGKTTLISIGSFTAYADSPEFAGYFKMVKTIVETDGNGKGGWKEILGWKKKKPRKKPRKGGRVPLNNLGSSTKKRVKSEKSGRENDVYSQQSSKLTVRSRGAKMQRVSVRKGLVEDLFTPEKTPPQRDKAGASGDRFGGKMTSRLPNSASKTHGSSLGTSTGSGPVGESKFFTTNTLNRHIAGSSTNSSRTPSYYKKNNTRKRPRIIY